MFYKSTIVLLLITLSFGVAMAKDHSFSWDHNHPNDNVVNYRIYWKTDVQEYDETRSIDTGYVNQFTIHNMSGDRRCFVITAIDDHDYESDYSDEVCSLESINWKIR